MQVSSEKAERKYKMYGEKRDTSKPRLVLEEAAIAKGISAIKWGPNHTGIKGIVTPGQDCTQLSFLLPAGRIYPKQEAETGHMVSKDVMELLPKVSESC